MKLGAEAQVHSAPENQDSQHKLNQPRQFFPDHMRFCQRAENGGLDLSWLDFAFLGRPDFQFKGAKILALKSSGTSELEIRAPPKCKIQPRRFLGPLILRRSVPNDLACFKEQLTCNPELVPVWGCLVKVLLLPIYLSFLKCFSIF